MFSFNVLYFDNQLNCFIKILQKNSPLKLEIFIQQILSIILVKYQIISFQIQYFVLTQLNIWIFTCKVKILSINILIFVCVKFVAIVVLV